mmetsp:Transcript_19695/g.29914  ORF Transcript_19695/g.29914 Transcript_19695/m.29914 type:complete len:899 (+) Transcript_19695:73-2769(+)
MMLIFINFVFLFIIVYCEVSHDDAKCILENKKIVFLGDSITRFCTFGFNVWLETGELPDEEYKNKWGNSNKDFDCCESQKWTDDAPISSNGAHKQWFWKEFDDINARTDFYFIQGAWYDAMEDLENELSDYDIIVFNAGLWVLLDECGTDWTDDCADDFQNELGMAADKLFKNKIAIWRSTTCCGVEEDGSWIPSIESLNDEAKDVLADENNVGIVNAYELWGYNDLDEDTTDGTHATVQKCFEINSLVLEKINILQGGKCSNSDSNDEDIEEETPHPTSSPTYQPTYGPTKKTISNPTKMPTREPSQIPTLRPTSLQPEPSPRPSLIPTRQPIETRPPTSKPSLAPTYDPTDGLSCSNDNSWYKKSEPSKTCDWVSQHSPRCGVKGNDNRLAEDACFRACGCPNLGSPTQKPAVASTPTPTGQPTRVPTTRPTPTPTEHPTRVPTIRPSPTPTMEPTQSPTYQPTLEPQEAITTTSLVLKFLGTTIPDSVWQSVLATALVSSIESIAGSVRVNFEPFDSSRRQRRLEETDLVTAVVEASSRYAADLSASEAEEFFKDQLGPSIESGELETAILDAAEQWKAPTSEFDSISSAESLALVESTTSVMYVNDIIPTSLPSLSSSTIVPTTASPTQRPTASPSVVPTTLSPTLIPTRLSENTNKKNDDAASPHLLAVIIILAVFFLIILIGYVGYHVFSLHRNRSEHDRELNSKHREEWASQLHKRLSTKARIVEDERRRIAETQEAPVTERTMSSQEQGKTSSGRRHLRFEDDPVDSPLVNVYKEQDTHPVDTRSYSPYGLNQDQGSYFAPGDDTWPMYERVTNRADLSRFPSDSNINSQDNHGVARSRPPKLGANSASPHVTVGPGGKDISSSRRAPALSGTTNQATDELYIKGDVSDV